MRKRSTLVSLLLVGLLALVGCPGDGGNGDGNDDGTDGDDGDQASRNVEDWDPALGTATVRGTVSFDGQAPERQAVDFGSRDECAAAHDHAPLTQGLVVNDDGGLKWVFVRVKSGPVEGYRFPMPEGDPPVIDQNGCMYEPHVWGVRAGQEFVVRNSDPFNHNIHAVPETNREFNFTQNQQGEERTERFPAPEVMVDIKCDIHPWMKSYVGVVPHPYFAVTVEDGTYEIPNLPPGEHVIETWHEHRRTGTQEQTVTVGDGETATLDFTYTP